MLSCSEVVTWDYTLGEENLPIYTYPERRTHQNSYLPSHACYMSGHHLAPQLYSQNSMHRPTPVCELSLARVYGRLLAESADSNPAKSMDAGSYDCCVLSGRGSCDGPIPNPEEFYRLWCVILKNEVDLASVGQLSQSKAKTVTVPFKLQRIILYDFLFLVLMMFKHPPSMTFSVRFYGCYLYVDPDPQGMTLVDVIVIKKLLWYF